MIYAIQGEPVRGMAGGSQIHARIIRNAAFALHLAMDNATVAKMPAVRWCAIGHYPAYSPCPAMRVAWRHRKRF